MAERVLTPEEWERFNDLVQTILRLVETRNEPAYLVLSAVGTAHGVVMGRSCSPDELAGVAASQWADIMAIAEQIQTSQP